jgi:4'-phosphopantetheinyl transferase
MIVAFENWQSTRNPKPLASGEVHLWRASLDVSPEMRVILSHDDWIEARRFHYEDERERFIATRGLLRLILARYLAASPCALRFSAGLDGKPQLTTPATTLRFHVSQSEKLMLLAITHGRQVGVDVEYVRRDVPFESLADHYFEPDDAWDLRLLPAAERAWKFYDIWTSTEARLKASEAKNARGLHLADRDDWALLTLTPAAGYAAALAVEGSDFALECWSWEP